MYAICGTVEVNWGNLYAVCHDKNGILKQPLWKNTCNINVRIKFRDKKTDYLTIITCFLTLNEKFSSVIAH